jgi:prophage tail gpP-like protein
MPETISILIDKKRFLNWENVNINLSLDSIDTFSLGTSMSPENIDFVRSFEPFKYPELELRAGDELLLRGVVFPKETALGDKNLSLAGSSLPGILNNLPVPPDKYPLEFKNQDLRQIATTLAGYYGVSVQFAGAPGAPFSPAVSPEPAEKILEFLVKLAKKRSLLVGNTLDGELLFFSPGQSVVSTPLQQGEMPLLDAKIGFDDENMFSSVTGFGAAEAGRDPESFTVPLPLDSSINRPFVYTVSESQGADLQAAVKFKSGRIFANAVKLSADVLNWRGANGKFWLPGDFILLRAPGLYFYNETKLMIRGIGLNRTAADETASLDLVFPGVYSGELPSRFPWE